ncbi:MAG: response regulator [Myxococcales bacterium]|nr:response regulator [Myxococcales bacterium]
MFSALIIDADGKTPEAIKQLLRPYGIEFTVTENAPEAVNVARTTAPDLIFIRAELPITSGFSVCNRLRRHEQTAKIPLIIYASNVSQEVFDQHRKTRRSADDYLRMPFNREQLVASVRGILSLGDPIPESALAERSRPVSAARSAPRPAAPAREPEPEPVLELEDDDIPEIEPEPEPPPPPRPSRRSEPRPAADPLVELTSDTSDAPEERGAAASGGYRAQRELLQLKTQLNAKKRELLSMTDELEERERAVLDAKRKNRELQAQSSELESQVLSAQEQLLAAQEQSEALARDKATLLRREEGLKNRLEGTQKKVKELEAELNDTHTLLVDEQKKSRATIDDLMGRLEETLAQFMAIEKQRDSLTERLVETEEQLKQRSETLSRTHARIDQLEAQLDGEREDRKREARQLEERNKHTLEANDAEHAFAVEQLKLAHERALEELAATLETTRQNARQEEARLSQALAKAREQAQEESERLATALAEAESSARDELQRLSAAMTEAEQESRGEIDRLTDTLAEQRREAALRAEQDKATIDGLEEQIAQLKRELEAGRATLRARNEAGARAQQALAVALKLLEHHTVTS